MELRMFYYVLLWAIGKIVFFVRLYCVRLFLPLNPYAPLSRSKTRKAPTTDGLVEHPSAKIVYQP
jgi:hypothetical protein